MKKFVMFILFSFVLSSVALASPLTDYSKGAAALDLSYRVSPDFDVNAKVNDFNVTDAAKDFGIPTNFDGDSNLEWGLTYGIGNNWALQYRQATPKGKLTLIDYSWDDYAVEKPAASKAVINDLPFYSANLTVVNKTRTEEFNVLHKLDKNFSLFTGLVRATPSIQVNAGVEVYPGQAIGGDISFNGHDKNIWQIGIVAVKSLNNDLTAFGTASYGNDYRNFEAGLGYKITKNIEFNVNYRDMKIEDMKLASLYFTDSSEVQPLSASSDTTRYDLTTDTRIKGWGFGVTYNF
ncbi:hypothetical protein [Dendrosporobacter sp. 1207_IL3150]|uniref:hypothetical protein n=1 Tax=Dendrosporobacter sp. 1207_IL3150 TaxID=3084054 RepID=UPI002FDB3FD3